MAAEQLHPATQWATTLFGDDGAHVVFTLTADGQRRTILAPTPADIAPIADGRAGADVWVGMARMVDGFKVVGNKRGTHHECASISTLYADFDIAGEGHKTEHRLCPDLDTALQLVATFPLPPTCIVHTGGGIQPYWALTEPVDHDDAIALLNTWADHWLEMGDRHGVHVDSVFDITRVLRVPGTFNHKTGTPRPVTIIEWSPNARHHPSDIDDVCIARTITPRRLASVVGYVGPARPGDDFAARHTCGEILAAQGWTLHHTDHDGNEQWTRPGKDRRQGTSATVYAADGRCVIWTDAVPGLAPRDSLNPYRLLTKLVHAGDFAAAARDLAARGYGERIDVDTRGLVARPTTTTTDGPDMTPPEPVDGDQLRDVLIDWGTFWSNEDDEVERWLVEPVLPAKRSVSIHAPGGTGKSLLALHMAASFATGGRCLATPAGPPRDVLYIDYEMTKEDLAERLETMGYGPDTDLSHLHYALIPPIDPLDTATGAAQIRHLAALVSAELVIIDTFARAVAGDENEADTVRAFYRWTGSMLKHDGRALVRIDHTGKDSEKGARGTSAKRDDVDVVWRLTVIQGGLELKAEKKRMDWVPATVTLDLDETDDLRWHVRAGTAPGWPAGTADAVATLQALGLPVSASRRASAAALKAAGIKMRTALLGAAIKHRREEAKRLADPSNLVAPEPLGSDDISCHPAREPLREPLSGDSNREPLQNHGNQNPKDLLTDLGTTREPREPLEQDKWFPEYPPLGGYQEPVPAPSDPESSQNDNIDDGELGID
jgi:hypothetical protein